ncbi:MAG TPA: hypothetical protein VH083_19550 [Myxococcales bacterium]|jgi:urea transporter|nr:hypothetical protein [Myxococcales bacterium]
MSETYSKKKEFFKGFFLPLVFAGVGFSSGLILEPWGAAHAKPGAGAVAYPVAGGLALIGSVTLAFRWWKLYRWRSYGVIAGFFGIAPMVAAIALAYVFFFDVNFHPH